MSLGGDIGPTAEQDVFSELYTQNGILSIAAAGNYGDSSYSYPASYDNVLSIGAVDGLKNWASFSQFNDRVDLVAPCVEEQHILFLIQSIPQSLAVATNNQPCTCGNHSAKGLGSHQT